MPYRKLEFAAGEHYHLYNRGVAKQPIFLDPEDYTFFINKLDTYAQRFSITVIAFCLLPNHYHLFVRQQAENSAGKLAQHTSYVHSRRFNRRHGRQGTLFQGRFGARRISEQNDAQHLCAYIHANPLAAGLASKLMSWPYSDLEAWLDRSKLIGSKKEVVDDLFPSGPDYLNFLQGVIEKRMFAEAANHW